MFRYLAVHKCVKIPGCEAAPSHWLRCLTRLEPNYLIACSHICNTSDRKDEHSVGRENQNLLCGLWTTYNAERMQGPAPFETRKTVKSTF